ncbi:MAG: amidohydrolase family protein, partial [Anaerolineaceae bacterium]|nr:amidohydrolase family protein [Anaerolineaceae bacterium]
FDQRRCFTALQNLHASGELRLRVLKSIPLPDLEHAIALGLRSGFGDDFLRIGSVKIFSDGALGPLTAAMLHPYTNTQDKLGMLLLTTSQIYEIGCQAVANGFSLAVHAIGDRANREALEAFEQLRAFELDQGLPAYRHRIEHVQLLHPDDLNRLARLNLIASVQPIHATSDMDMAKRHWGERAAFSYAYGALHKHGTLLTLGSDAPVESPNPFWGIHAAVTRCRRDGSPNLKGWYATQRLTLQDALYGYTVAPAITAGVQDRLGKIASDFHADLIVLASDPFDTPPQEIQHLRPQAVMVGGEWVWQS